MARRYSNSDVLAKERKLMSSYPSNLTEDARLQQSKRRLTQSALEFKIKVKELSIAGHTPNEISKITGRTKQGVLHVLKRMLDSQELRPDQTSYRRVGSREETKWYKIIETAIRDLHYYSKAGLVPTARKHGYRMIENALEAKKQGSDVHNLGLPDLPDPNSKQYTKAKKSFLDGFYKKTAEARRGVDWTYTKLSTLPKMPLRCYRDELRTTIGYTDMDKDPHDPTPDEASDDPIETAQQAILECQRSIIEYNGLCYQGEKGVNPGKMYMQPIYCEIMCESETIQPDLEKFQDDIHVKVTALRGQFSTPIMAECCTRFEEIGRRYSHINKIVVLYFGDSDKAGNHIRRKVQVALKFYSGGGILVLDNGKKLKIPASPDIHIPVEVEVVHVAITPEQVKKYKLTGYQLEAFLTNEKRLGAFKQIERDAIRNCWKEEVWLDNCPPEKYDYKANGEEEPHSIDPDADTLEKIYGDTDEPHLIVREKMAKMATEAFRPGWESDL